MTVLFENVGKSFGEKKVLSGLNACFEPARPVCIMGPSGSGKTTLLRLVMGLEHPDSGKITVQNGSRFAPVFQEDRLCEHWSGVQNVLLCAGAGASPALIRQLFSELGLSGEDLSKPVKNLSGGQKRRVALARALAAPADALLMDEPLKGLDEASRDACISTILKYRAGRLLLAVTHSREEAELFSAEIFELPPHTKKRPL